MRPVSQQPLARASIDLIYCPSDLILSTFMKPYSHCRPFLRNLTAGWLATIGSGATGADVEPAGTGYVNL
jgi:hypothetical protein